VVAVYSVSILCRKCRHSWPMYRLAASVAIVVVDFMCNRPLRDGSIPSTNKGSTNFGSLCHMDSALSIHDQVRLALAAAFHPYAYTIHRFDHRGCNGFGRGALAHEFALVHNHHPVGPA